MSILVLLTFIPLLCSISFAVSEELEEASAPSIEVSSLKNASLPGCPGLFLICKITGLHELQGTWSKDGTQLSKNTSQSHADDSREKVELKLTVRISTTVESGGGSGTYVCKGKSLLVGHDEVINTSGVRVTVGYGNVTFTYLDKTEDGELKKILRKAKESLLIKENGIYYTTTIASGSLSAVLILLSVLLLRKVRKKKTEQALADVARSVLEEEGGKTLPGKKKTEQALAEVARSVLEEEGGKTLPGNGEANPENVDAAEPGGAAGGMESEDNTLEGIYENEEVLQNVSDLPIPSGSAQAQLPGPFWTSLRDRIDTFYVSVTVTVRYQLQSTQDLFRRQARA